ncbi:rhodanese-like domain-containing protein [Nostocoides sp. F2B08]|uniref:rhodanese-like domain-containing protein n=1 Tax=Nostocoides sp. F2B08 TaxID=2653936 RepID=UPI001262D63E|nr:rhodanese-like domain-containing protein [Tetrasphaera sp. F2B08]KAB7745179.1 rhodanese-like domain-containing protein [Tetrasphaera sp. F2B08]
MKPRRTVALVLSALLAVIGLSGCSDSDPEVSATAGTAATAQPAAGSELDAADFAAALKAPETVILDVRTPEEFAEGHIPGAVNIDVQAPDFASQVAALDPHVPYAVYCRSGNRSQVALDLMAQMGVTDAYHLGGGVGAWQQAGGELVSGGE